MRRLALIATTSCRLQMTASSLITDTEMAQLFHKWWTDSYPTPPGTHAQMTHLGWGRYLLEEISRREESQRG